MCSDNTEPCSTGADIGWTARESIRYSARAYCIKKKTAHPEGMCGVEGFFCEQNVIE